MSVANLEELGQYLLGPERPSDWMQAWVNILQSVNWHFEQKIVEKITKFDHSSSL